MNFAETFPVDKLSHSELYARLRAFDGDCMGLCTFAMGGITNHPLSMSQVLAFCYQKSKDSAEFIRSSILSFALPTDICLRLLATAVVPYTPDEELFSFMEGSSSPFFRDRMMKLLKRSKRHSVIDRLLNSTKYPSNDLAELIHMASPEALEKHWWDYESRKGVNFEAVFKFHANTFLCVLRNKLSSAAWQDREIVWAKCVIERKFIIEEVRNVDLIKGLFELYYEFPATQLLSNEFELAPELPDEQKVLTKYIEFGGLAVHLPFDFLLQYLTRHQKLMGPSQLFKPFASWLWELLLNRPSLKPADAKALCHVIIDKVGSYGARSTSIVTLEDMQNDFWYSLFTKLTEHLVNFNRTVGDGLNHTLLDKILKNWEKDFLTITFLASSEHSAFIEKELFDAIRNKMIAGTLESLRTIDVALESRFPVILKSYANNHTKAIHLESLGNTFAKLYSIYDRMLSDLIGLSQKVSETFYGSFHRLLLHLVEKILNAVKIRNYVKAHLKIALDPQDGSKEISNSNPQFAAFIAQVRQIQFLPSLTQWIALWEKDFAAYFITCANPALHPTKLEKMFFDIVRNSATTFFPIFMHHMTSEQCLAFGKYLLDITTECQAHKPSSKSSSSYIQRMNTHGKYLSSIFMSLINRCMLDPALIASKNYSAIWALVEGFYEVFQWGETIHTTLTTGKYTYVFQFLLKLVREPICSADTIIPVDLFLSPAVLEQVAINAHPVFDVKKDTHQVTQFIDFCKNKRCYYPFMQAIVIKLVEHGCTKPEYANMLDMYRFDGWKKEQAQPSRIRSVFEEHIFKVLPVEHELSLRYFKRRMMISNMDEKVKYYTEYLESANLQTNVFSRASKDWLHESYRMIQPLIKNVQWNAKSLRYPFAYSWLEAYIPKKADLCSPDLKTVHSLPAAQEMTELLQVICTDKFATEPDFFRTEVTQMFSSAASEAMESYAEYLLVREVAAKGEVQVNNLDHYIAILKHWIEFFYRMNYFSVLKISGKENAESVTIFDINFGAGYGIFQHIDSTSFQYLGVSREQNKSAMKKVARQYLEYVLNFYTQYVPKMPLSTSAYPRYEFTKEALKIIQSFLEGMLHSSCFSSVFLDMFQVLVRVISNEKEKSNMELFKSTLEALEELDLPHIHYEKKKLTFQSVHFEKPVELDEMEFDEEEVQFLEAYRAALLKFAGEFTVFPTAHLMCINRRIAFFRTPQKNDMTVMVDSLEEIATNVCPSIIRYKFVSNVLLEHRPTFFLRFLRDELAKPETRLRKNPLLVKHTTRFSVRFNPRLHNIHSEELEYLQELFETILLDTNSETLKDRKNAAVWVTHLQAQHVDKLLTLYDQLIGNDPTNGLPVEKMDVEAEVDYERNEDEDEFNDGEHKSEGGMDIDMPKDRVNPALKRAVLIATLVSLRVDFKKTLRLIFQSNYLNDSDVNVHLLSGLVRYARVYGKAFSDEVLLYLDPKNPAYSKMGVVAFKAIIRLCEQLYGSSSLLIRFWENRANLHRDVVTCILRSLIAIYGNQGDENAEVAQVLYSFADQLQAQTVNDIDMLRVLMHVIPGDEFFASHWLSSQYRPRATASIVAPKRGRGQPQTAATTEETPIVYLRTLHAASSYYHNVVKKLLAKAASFHENGYPVVITTAKYWFGISHEQNIELRDFYIQLIDNIAIPFFDNEVRCDAVESGFQVIAAVVATCRSSPQYNTLNPVDAICALFLRYMKEINENSQITFDQKFSLLQKVKYMQDNDSFKVQSVYDNFDKKFVREMNEFYATLSGVYDRMKRRKYN